MATLTFFKYLRVIQVDDPVDGTAVTCQDLINAIRDYEEELDFMDYGHIANASGKQQLSETEFVGITLELINDWRVQFESPGPPTITVYVRGGNLVATNSYNDNPIKASDYVTVIIAQSSAPTIVQPAADYSLIYLIESLRGKHASIGNVWYWNPTSGSDASDGTTPANAVQTFAQAQTLVSDSGGAGRNDVVFALSTASGGVTTVTEQIEITVPTLKVRGPGFPFQFSPGAGGAGTDTVTISADSCEFSGFYVTTHTSGGPDNAITITGNDALVKDVWVTGATGNGIDISSSTRSTIDTCAIEDCIGNGIELGAETTKSTIKTCIISGSTAGDGVDIAASALSTDNIFENNVIYNNSGYGIHIGAGVVRTGVRLHHTFSNNTPGTIGDIQDDGGTDTFIETGGAVTPENIQQIVDDVWDEVISPAHTGAGTAGKTLKDAKAKATLASLK
jgi:hypothetical protein